MRKNKGMGKKIACGCMFVLGLGLCIAGVFVPGLLAIGTPILGAALAAFSNIMKQNDGVPPAPQSATNNYHPYGDVKPSEVKEKNLEVEKTKTIYRFKIKDKEHEAPLFAFKAKKDAYREQEREDKQHAPDHTITEVGSKLAPELLEQIQKLNDIIHSIDLSSMEKVLDENNPKADRHHQENV